MSETPRTWAETMTRLAYAFGGREGEPYAAAEEWVREACEATWGRELTGLHRSTRALALQKTIGTLLHLEAQGELAFTVGLRRIVQEAFARFWNGAALHGPPWQLDPTEQTRPRYTAWSVSADFD